MQVIEKGAIWGRRRTREVTSYCRVVFLEFICVALVFVACFLALVFVGFVPRVLVFVFCILTLCICSIFERAQKQKYGSNCNVSAAACRGSKNLTALIL